MAYAIRMPANESLEWEIGELLMSGEEEAQAADSCLEKCLRSQAFQAVLLDTDGVDGVWSWKPAEQKTLVIFGGLLYNGVRTGQPKWKSWCESRFPRIGL